MKKIILFIFLSFASQILSANQVEDYISVLEWDSKWEKITTRAIDGYIERGIKLYPSSFTQQQKSEASIRIRKSLENSLGWSAMGNDVVAGFRKECGDELLDLMLEIYSGVEFLEKEKTRIATEYGQCAPSSLRGAMNLVADVIDNFGQEEKGIISRILKK